MCALITPTHVLCANVGDSRCVLSTEVQIISMSEDHKPSIVNEHDRITRAGGFVLCDRVNGEVRAQRQRQRRCLDGTCGCLTYSFPCPSLLVVVEQLAMSRALGDYQYKGNVGLGPEHQMVRA